MWKIILLMIFFITFASFSEAAEKSKVAVMDLGAYDGSYSNNLNTENIGAMASEYIIQALHENGKFTIIDREIVDEEIAAQRLKISGLIPPSVAKEIAQILKADYLIYCNINSVDSDSLTVEVVMNGGKFHSVKVCMIVRMVNVKTGDIVAVAKGEGVSKSSEIKVGKSKLGFITIGKHKIPQISVHNAAKKAAYSMVDKLVASLPFSGLIIADSIVSGFSYQESSSSLK